MKVNVGNFDAVARMESKKRRGTVYQLRFRPDEWPSTLIDRLLREVWRMLLETSDRLRVDPHRWVEARDILAGVLGNRLVRYGECGTRSECATPPGKVFWPREAAGGVPGNIFLLELRRDIDRLCEQISCVLERRFRDVLRLPLKERRVWRLDMRHALRGAFSDNLYFSPVCQECPARNGFRERRLLRG